jgi:outer membrane protein assembly factor BamE (lipoprotein component of BamABCDE complex)
MRKTIFLLMISSSLTGCVVDRNIRATNAKSDIVGFSKQEVVGCMGIPHRQASIGGTEIWEYSTGNEHNVGFVSDGWGGGYLTNKTRNCTATLTFDSSGSVSAMQYSGKTGGLIWGVQKCGELFRGCF